MSVKSNSVSHTPKLSHTCILVLVGVHQLMLCDVKQDSSSSWMDKLCTAGEVLWHIYCRSFDGAINISQSQSSPGCCCWGHFIRADAFNSSRLWLSGRRVKEIFHCVYTVVSNNDYIYSCCVLINVQTYETQWSTLRAALWSLDALSLCCIIWK